MAGPDRGYVEAPFDLPHLTCLFLEGEMRTIACLAILFYVRLFHNYSPLPGRASRVVITELGEFHS